MSRTWPHLAARRGESVRQRLASPGANPSRRVGVRGGPILLAAVFSLLAVFPSPAAGQDRPNVIFILADDLGYGDVNCFGGDLCLIDTPHYDRLAAEGMRFTHAYAPASICVQTRIGIMTGRYAWRFGPAQPGGPWGYLGVQIPPDRLTLGDLMTDCGYRAAYIGKWHLGTRMETLDGAVQGPENVDYQRPLSVGPGDFGFAESFILPGSLDMFPYAFVRNHEWVGSVTAQKGWSAFNRVGPAAEDFEDTQVLDTLTSEAESLIRSHSADPDASGPFFIYLALTSPHTPLSPSAPFDGLSSLGVYGDFVMETDHCIGRILDVLDECGIADQTLVIASSDHGPGAYAGRRREATARQMLEMEAEGHFSRGPFRGYKFSIQEGGLRVPFLARWPERVPAGSQCDAIVGLHDLIGTLADLNDISLEPDQAPDSHSFLPLLLDPRADACRPDIILQSGQALAFRDGDWKLSLSPGCGSNDNWGNATRDEEAWRAAIESFGRRPRNAGELEQAPFLQLYNLRDDRSESNDLAAAEPQLVESMIGKLRSQIESGRSTPGPAVANDRDAIPLFRSVPRFVWE